MTYFSHQKIVVPSYTTLQDIFSRAFSGEEKRLNAVVMSIQPSIKKQLSTLIHRGDGLTVLNIIRADQKYFQYTAVRTEVDKALPIADLYAFAKKFIPTLTISKNAVRYYADIAEQYAASRLRRLSKPQQWLHAICFVFHRYRQIMDNLIISFSYHTRSIMNAGKTYVSMAHMNHSSDNVVNFPKLAKFLKWFPVRSEKMSEEELNEKAYNILPKEQFSALAEFIDGKTFDKKAALWEYFGKSSRIFSLYLRPIFTTVVFEYYKDNSDIDGLIDILKSHYSSGKGPSKLKICDDLGLTIPKSMTKYLKRKPTGTHIDPYLFEFFVYKKVYHEIDRGRLYCNDSVSYRDIDSDLIDDALVDDADKIAEDFGYPKIPIYCDQRLDDALQELNEAWDRTTGNISEKMWTMYQVLKTYGMLLTIYMLPNPLIKPNRVINVDRIRSQRRGVIRVLLSLIMQENTQSNIIRKLNSHARYARLKAALFEYNSIFKSIHLLNLIDDMQLRKAIRSARNRTEAYHQLQSNIRRTYKGVFQGKRIVENRVSAHAARLIANCVIAYNRIILNYVYEKMLANGTSQEIIDEFTRISPIAWTHTLFTGRYSFKKTDGNIDVEAMAKILEEHLRQHFWNEK